MTYKPIEIQNAIRIVQASIPHGKKLVLTRGDIAEYKGLSYRSQELPEAFKKDSK